MRLPASVQSHPLLQRSHDPDLAHGRRDHLEPDGPLSGPQRHRGLELVRRLQARRVDRCGLRAGLHPLDRPRDGQQHAAEPDHRRPEEHARAVGPVHARGLRCRRGVDREHGTREHEHLGERRHHQGVRQPLRRGDVRELVQRRQLRHAAAQPGRRGLPGGRHPLQPGRQHDRRPVRGRPQRADQAPGYVAAMQEAGIPVTFAYIRDAHDDFENCNSGNANGPGNACSVQQLKHQDEAFEAFFERMAADGITKSNTLFVFTVEEGDHYAGGPATNQDVCDGVATPCTYTAGTSGPNTVGEITTNLNQLVQTETGDTTPFNIHFDDAPTVYVPDAPNGPPGPNNPKVRRLEQEFSGLTVNNPRTGKQDVVTQHIADKVAQDILHMTTTDPLRTPSFTLFGNADYFFQSSCAAGSDPNQAGCPIVGPRFAWNHGDDNPEIARTWAGIVGPGIRTLGQTGTVWTDHTDLRPTMLSLLGLTDDYRDDGNLVAQVVDDSALPPAVLAHRSAYEQLQSRLKQLNAPFGQFGHDAEVVSTTAVVGDDSPYNGRDARVTCAVNLTCKVTQRAAETRIVLRRGGRTVATGHTARARTVVLHARRTLRHGRYTLVVAVVDRGHMVTVIQRKVRL